MRLKPRLLCNTLHSKDPTRTTTLRRKYCLDLSQRFKELRKRLMKLLVEEDAFGLNEPTLLKVNARYTFSTDKQKLEEFRKWLAAQSQNLILSDPTTTADDWWAKYINEAYKQGQGRAFDDTKKPYARGYASDESTADFYKGSKYEFLSSSFNQPETIEKVQLLAGRNFSELKGMTDAMATVLTRDLAEGLARGDNPRTIAARLEKSLALSENRALTIARTEIIRAHAEGALDAMEKMGVAEVGVAVEWSTTDDSRVCPLCKPLDGIILKISEARGMFPRHPNCRCSPVPANVGEELTTPQKKTQAEVDRAIDESIEAEISEKNKNKTTLEEQRKKSTWQGADTKVGKVRPRSIYDQMKVSIKPVSPDNPPVKPSIEPPKPVPEVKVQNPVPKPTTPAKPPLSLQERLKGDDLEQLRKTAVDSLKEYQQEYDRLKKDVQTKLELVEEKLRDQSAILRQYENDKLAGVPIDQKKITKLLDKIDKEYEELRQAFKDAQAKRREHEEKKSKILVNAIKVDDSRNVTVTYPKTITTPANGKVVTTKRPTQEYREKTKQAEEFITPLLAKLEPDQQPIQLDGYQLPDGMRAFHRATEPKYLPNPKGGVFLTGNDDIAVYVHEIGHRIENNHGDALKKCAEFVEMRIKRAGTADVKMADKFPGYGYDDKEIGNPDEFNKAFSDNSAHYIGKVYKNDKGEVRATEALSMGLEKLYNDPLTFAEKDPEYFNFIIGVLRGVL